jgi:hypothetical protein
MWSSVWNTRNKIEEEGTKWVNGEVCFQYLVDTLEACIEKGLIKFTDKMVGALSVWSMVHGLVSLNVRCRFKVSELDEADLPGMMDVTIENYLNMIKA